METNDIKSQFIVDWENDFGLLEGEFVFNSLEMMYRGRLYHNLNHVINCLSEAASYPYPIHHCLSIAIWFHDVVYDLLRTDNEECSAKISGLALMTGCAYRQDIDDVQRLILATRHYGNSLNKDEKIIADIDMSIIGAEPEEYAKYAAAIAGEYSRTSVTSHNYMLGRTAFLEGLRGRIFHTDYFHDKYDDRARNNIGTELNRLYDLLNAETKNECQYRELILI